MTFAGKPRGLREMQDTHPPLCLVNERSHRQLGTALVTSWKTSKAWQVEEASKICMRCIVLRDMSWDKPLTSSLWTEIRFERVGKRDYSRLGGNK